MHVLVRKIAAGAEALFSRAGWFVSGFIFSDYPVRSACSVLHSGDLPVILRMSEIADYTLNDFQDLFSDFSLETDLEMTGFLSLGENSGKLRMTLVVKQPEQKLQRILQ